MIQQLLDRASGMRWIQHLRAPNEAAAVFRWAMIGWYLGYYVKLSFSIEEALVHFHYPLSHPSFAGWRSDAIVLLIIYAIPLAFVPLLLRMSRFGLLVVSSGCLLVSFLLLLHVATFNDATYTTSFWTGTWLLWLAWNSHRNDWGFVLQARRLSMAIVSLIFLGGFVGKLTPEFWSGEMFYHYLFLDRNILFYPLLRESASPEQLRDIATWFSRSVLVVEGSMIFLWIGRFRLIAPIMILVMFGFIFGSTPWLLSVFASLIGMLLANYAWDDHQLD